MPAKMNETDLRLLWVDRIERSREKRNQEKGTWDRILDIYNMDYNIPIKGRNGPLTVNLFYTTQENKLAVLYAQNPKVALVAEQENWVIPAKSLATRVNYWMRCVGDKGIKTYCKRIIRDALTYPYGVAKLGVDVYPDGTTDPMTGEPGIKDKKISLMRVNPVNILFDDNADNIDEIEWVIEMIEKPLEDVKANKSYENTEDLKALNGEGLHSNPVKADEQKVLLYEIHDYKNDRMITLAEGNDKILRIVDGIKEKFGVQQLYTILRFNERPNKLYPQCDLALWLQQQEELDKVATFRRNACKKANRKILVESQAIDKTNLNQLTSSNDGEIVIVKKGGVQNGMIAPMKEAETGGDIAIFEAQLRSNIAELSGIGQNWRGDITKSTATEADIVDKRAITRLNYHQDIVNDWMIELLYKVAQMLQAHDMNAMSIPDTSSGGVSYTPYDPEETRDIKYNVSLEITTALPHGDLVMRKQWSDLFSMFAQDPLINPVAIREEVLKNFGVIDTERFINKPVQTTPEGILGMQPPAEQGAVGGNEAKSAYQETSVPNDGELTGREIRDSRI